MSASGLVQGVILILVIVTLVVLVQMDGGVQRELARFDLPSLKSSEEPKQAATAAAATAGVMTGVTPGPGVAGAMQGVSNATSASMNRSMKTLENRGR